ncbi:hypothetical protein CP8484711_1078, partial [Chlamydia psittaci 84-8471/1]
NVPC